MKMLFLIVNSACDLACEYCFYTIGHEARSAARILPEQFDIFADAIVKNGFTSVILTGGDPFYSKYKHETYDLIAKLKLRHLRVLVNTSGVKLSEDDLDRIVELEIDRVDISVNSLVRELHNAERGFFEDAVFTLKGLLARGYGERISTTTVITEKNAEYAAATIGWLQALGIRDTRYQPVFRKEVQDYSAIAEAMRSCARQYHQNHAEKYLSQCDAAFCNYRAIDDSVCQMGKLYYVCDYDGTLTPCFHRAEVKLGNILRDEASTIQENIAQSELHNREQPSCFGKHCVSLYDNPLFWKEV